MGSQPTWGIPKRHQRHPAQQPLCQPEPCSALGPASVPSAVSKPMCPSAGRSRAEHAIGRIDSSVERALIDVFFLHTGGWRGPINLETPTQGFGNAAAEAALGPLGTPHSWSAQSRASLAHDQVLLGQTGWLGKPARPLLL
jgi:hypothetical protein